MALKKIQQTIFTHIGEMRPVKRGEWYLDKGDFKCWGYAQPSCDSFPILQKDLKDIQSSKVSPSGIYWVVKMIGGGFEAVRIFGKADDINDYLYAGNIYETEEEAKLVAEGYSAIAEGKAIARVIG